MLFSGTLNWWRAAMLQHKVPREAPAWVAHLAEHALEVPDGHGDAHAEHEQRQGERKVVRGHEAESRRLHQRRARAEDGPQREELRERLRHLRGATPDQERGSWGDAKQTNRERQQGKRGKEAHRQITYVRLRTLLAIRNKTIRSLELVQPKMYSRQLR